MTEIGTYEPFAKAAQPSRSAAGCSSSGSCAMVVI
jgi:hypothetical protein